MGSRVTAKPMDLLQGTLDVFVLRTLAWGTMHGFAVSRWIHQRTDGVLEIEDAPLYKSLHRLERAGFVSAEWGLSENNGRARYYSLTSAGRRQLAAEESAWRRYAEAVFKVTDDCQRAKSMSRSRTYAQLRARMLGSHPGVRWRPSRTTRITRPRPARRRQVRDHWSRTRCVCGG
jgi:PadR family transcriptional regulator, regulatory protein PadR